jgi:hypothetical protein
MAVGTLVPLDSLNVEVLSDNVSDTSVSKTSFACSEIDNIVAAERIGWNHDRLARHLESRL